MTLQEGWTVQNHFSGGRLAHLRGLFIRLRNEIPDYTTGLTLPPLIKLILGMRMQGLRELRTEAPMITVSTTDRLRPKAMSP